MPTIKGRGAQIHPTNRFERISLDLQLADLDLDDDYLQTRSSVRTEYYLDDTRSVITENDSPDISYRYSLNPYRGCAHGCPYCYARPTHEYLGWDAGLDFESRILVKKNAAELFRQWLRRPDWKGEPIIFSGVTDCYQPAERHFRLTRSCLEAALDSRQPIHVVTKNALITRDMDILRQMAQLNLVHVNLSLTTLNVELARMMEPRTSTPAARLRAVRELSEAGVPTSVFVSPIIPGLTDSEIAPVLSAISEAGAVFASSSLLRLPGAVGEVFVDWMKRMQPDAVSRVLTRIQSTRGGRLNDSRFGFRMRGEGPIAEAITRSFRIFARKFNLDRPPEPLDSSQFRAPRDPSGQLRLFD